MNDRAVVDAVQRERALDPRLSFIVQAPAGSGKTELLIQRYLVLLATVDKPEEIAAITFTRKAASEMRKRVFDAIAFARTAPRPPAAHAARTWDLARAVIARDAAKGWRLHEGRSRLRVQTIDALCASLARQMPVLSTFGAQPRVVEDARALHAEAARNTIAALEDPGDPNAADIEALLRHVDNDALEAEALLARMLEKRDQWLRALGDAPDRARLEAVLAALPADAASRARPLLAAAGAAGVPPGDDRAAWIAYAGTFLTAEGKWRAKSKLGALATSEPLRHALRMVRRLPPPAYADAQWEVLRAIAAVLIRAAAELKLVFARHGEVDFAEISAGAIRALHGEDGPTDLMLALDYRIRHLLVDEFQDTSYTQLDLLQHLTAGWEPGDGRTLFVVGDPMQSIYRFRQAEVALFLAAQRHGIGGVALEPLRLAANFRSQAGIVGWVNEAFPRVMPAADDLATGSVRYSPSSAMHPPLPAGVRVHAFHEDDEAGEAERVVELARQALAAGAPEAEDDAATVAILVRNRMHLEAIVPRLAEAGLRFRAIEIEPLGHRPVVQDLLALTRALTHLADRTAWMSVLRAPWCGLRLEDLHALATRGPATPWEAMADAALLANLSDDGRARVERMRAILGPLVAERRRHGLRDGVESAWLALAGPACVDEETDLEDARVYLDFLEDSERAGMLEDIHAFEEGVAALFALPDVHASERLQVMTIHRAKGLEFGTVIVPGLGAGSGRDERDLLLWMQTFGPDAHGEPALLMAAPEAAGADSDDAYEYIRELDKEKARHECERLLYVAATRAKHRLHLLGCVPIDAKSGAPQPARGSLLHTLWPAVAGHFASELAHAPPLAAPGAAQPGYESDILRRLPARFAIAAPPAVAWDGPSPRADERAALEFSWVGETARRVGTVVHGWLQRIADDALQGWTPARVRSLGAAIRNQLAAQGVAMAEIDLATERVQRALAATLEDPRGRWLLGPHPRARSEYRITAIVEGAPRMLVVDRHFVDAEGRAWIVDYKTSMHEGGGLEGFLDREQSRYREQLERYAHAVMPRQNARLGLYFPLLRGWREWEITTEEMQT
ncbi:MAG TPA: UvrD-helicase domain-containing protein [Usitatibacter sp.]|nr:UvrD-helicase domain-containing protein [Usitatibacter sp.]